MQSNNIKSGIQNGLIKNLYDYGCYFLCICYIAEKHNKYLSVDIIKFANECIENKWLKADFTVVRPDLILGKLLGKTVTVVSVESLDNMEYKEKVNCWYNKRTNYTHFNLDDFDSLSNSVTVKEGKIISYRLFSW